MKVAYADPPYIGQAVKHYSHDPLCAEVDHKTLIQQILCKDYDCWALSLSSPSLQQILSYCPPDVRVLAWVKPFCAFKANVTLAYAWEPVIIWHPRQRSRELPTVRDWVSASITRKRGLSGVKPHAFSYWLFEAIGLEPTDTFRDMYVGSGAVWAAWEQWRNQRLEVAPQLEMEAIGDACR